jgi:TolA-binding protein
MIQRVTRIMIVVLLLVALLVPPPFSLACGPDLSAPTYTDFQAPDPRDLSYIQGKLGLLQSGYWHVFLYEAYRNLSGKPFNQAELNSLQPDSSQAQANQPTDWVAEWRSSRAKLLGETEKNENEESHPYGIFRYEQKGQTYREYPNCLNGAFENAVHTMQDRAKKYGSNSPTLREWIAAQDQVFENCGRSLTFPIAANPVVIPAAARVEDPAEIRADRAYQIAAAHFYAGDLDGAQLAFEQIAKDPTSAYNRIAPYLVARVLIRKATLRGEGDNYDKPTLAQAEAQLHQVLANKDFAEYHDASQRLLNLVLVRLHRQERLQELERILGSPTTSKTFGQDLTDYLWLLDRPVLTKTVTLPPTTGSNTPQEGTTIDESSRLKAGDMTDWIFTFHEPGADAFEHSLQRWNETKSLPWLVAAISKVDSKDKALPDLLTAVSKIGPDSPAYLTVTFHRLRLLEQSGNLDAARHDLDQLFARSKASMPIATRNEFLALRMKLSANLAELLQFAPRISVDASGIAPIPSGQSDYTPGSPEYAATRPHLDSDASVVLTEKLPLRLLGDAAKSNSLPSMLRTDVAIAAWTRAILLKNEAVAQEMTPVLSELLPEVRPALEEYAAAPAGEQRDFTAIFEILRNPGFRPFVSASPGRGWFYSVGESRFNTLDEFEDNWWCSFALPKQDESWNRGNYYRMFAPLSQPLQLVYPGGVGSPHFLSEQDRADAGKEMAALTALPSAARWLGQSAIAWAKSHPDDPRVPEALHLVVRAWRYSCTESEGPNYSKQAFEILHSRYPDNTWTKQTPYWFK